MSRSEVGLEPVLAALQIRLDQLPVGWTRRRTFIATYRRTTVAVATAIGAGRFEDAVWVSGWTTEFADYFLRAHDADRADRVVPRPWRLAFGAGDDLHPLVHLLLGMNAHINFDLPQVLIDVIPAPEFDDPERLAERRRDHDRIDDILTARIASEDGELGGVRRLRDRLLTPLNRLASRRVLRESRRRVWHNVLALHAARLAGPEAYDARVAELEVLAAAKIADLLEPGQVLLRLALIGFGVRLPPS